MHTRSFAKTFVAILMIPLSLLALSGCAKDDADVTPVTVTGTTGLSVQHVDVDGRDVTCVVFTGHKKGGLSCDWSGSDQN